MRGYIGITDTGWYDHLQAKGPALEEVNFWQPNGGERLMKLPPGTPFLFKLKRAQGDAVVGFASYVRSIRLPIREAWQFFGDGNGVSSQQELLARVKRYRAKSGKPEPTANSDIGCSVLVSPIFFPRDRWVRGPSDWKTNIETEKRRHFEPRDTILLCIIWNSTHRRHTALALQCFIASENQNRTIKVAVSGLRQSVRIGQSIQPAREM